MNRRSKLVVAAGLVVLALSGVAIYFSEPARLASVLLGLERHHAGLTERAVDVAGHHIVYTEGGKGTPLVLVHGFAADKDNWTRFAGNFTGDYHVVALDMPGQGESSRDWNADYDVSTQADRLFAFTQALGLTKFHLVGNSMGGQVSAIFASRHPDVLLSLALFDASGLKAPHPSYLDEAVARGENPLVASTPDDYDKIVNLVFVNPPYIPRPLIRYFGARAIAQRPFNDKVFADRVKNPTSLIDLLPGIQTRTLVLFGDTDRVIDTTSADVFMAHLPHATKVIMTACGHAPMLERPDETAEHYRRFITTL